MARTRTRATSNRTDTTTTSRASRSKPAISYAESSSDGEDDYREDSESEGELITTPVPTQSRSSQRVAPSKSRVLPKRAHKHSTSLDPSTSQPVSKKRKQLHTRSRNSPTKPKPITAPIENTIQYSGFVPQWQTLPYLVLVEIFRYASYPLYDDQTFQPLASGRWLLNVARLCKAFAEPAFTVLYTSPPLVPMDKAHMLVDLLKMDPTKLAFKYRQKVKSLRIDVGQVAAYSLGAGRGHLDLYSLVKDMPRLVDLEFYHQKDMSPYRDLDAAIKWSYPASLFDALEYIDPKSDPLRGDKTSICKLRSWRWSSRLAGKEYPIESLRAIHLKPSFVSLRKIAFVNYQVPEMKKGEDAPPKHEEILASALTALPELSHLVFESCTLANSTLLPLLPTNLRNLELINCWEVSSNDFESFLHTHGHQLRCITLNHNISLSLCFLPSLGLACPKLEVLRVNLTYYHVHSNYNDSSKPAYDSLLFPGQVPFWPSTLKILELIHLRQWETEAAEMFFQSLLDSAATLSDLRILKIQAILNIAWRDRASFRDKWIGSLDRVFKRVCSPPSSAFTLRPIPATSSNLSIILPAIEQSKESGDMAPTKRKSLRSTSGGSSAPIVLDDPPATLSSRSVSPEEAPQGLTTRRSARTAGRTSLEGKYAESPDNSETEEVEANFELPDDSDRHIKRGKTMSRELAMLQKTAGIHGIPSQTASSAENSDSPLSMHDVRTKGKAREVIQGMCEIVQVRIDNLRPVENIVTEADFLDEEVPGDGDWDEDEDDVVDGYAW